MIGAFDAVSIGVLNGLEDLESGRRVETIPNYSIIENGQNTEKSPAELRGLTVNQTPVKYHQPTLVRKILMSK